MISKSDLEKIYRIHSPEIYTFLLRLTGSAESAEDILHDIFVSLVNYSTKKNIEMATVRAFLYKSAKNHTINYKKNKRNLNIELPENSPDKSDFVEKIENDQLLDEIYAIVNEMDGVTKSVFLLKKEFGYTNEEIAALAGVSERTVRRKLEKLLIHLSQSIDRDDILPFLLYICPFLSLEDVSQLW